MTFLQHLKEAYAFEEDLVHRINYVLNLLLDKTDLPQVNEIKDILETLTAETLDHKVTLEKIIAELE